MSISSCNTSAPGRFGKDKLLDYHGEVPSSCSTLLQGRDMENHWAEDKLQLQEIEESVSRQ
jgi:hypothetical protein